MKKSLIFAGLFVVLALSSCASYTNISRKNNANSVESDISYKYDNPLVNAYPYWIYEPNGSDGNAFELWLDIKSGYSLSQVRFSFAVDVTLLGVYEGEVSKVYSTKGIDTYKATYTLYLEKELSNRLIVFYEADILTPNGYLMNYRNEIYDNDVAINYSKEFNIGYEVRFNRGYRDTVYINYEIDNTTSSYNSAQSFYLFVYEDDKLTQSKNLLGDYIGYCSFEFNKYTENLRVEFLVDYFYLGKPKQKIVSETFNLFEELEAPKIASVTVTEKDDYRRPYLTFTPVFEEPSLGSSLKSNMRIAIYDSDNDLVDYKESDRDSSFSLTLDNLNPNETYKYVYSCDAEINGKIFELSYEGEFSVGEIEKENDNQIRVDRKGESYVVLEPKLETLSEATIKMFFNDELIDEKTFDPLNDRYLVFTGLKESGTYLFEACDINGKTLCSLSTDINLEE